MEDGCIEEGKKTTIAPSKVIPHAHDTASALKKASCAQSKCTTLVFLLKKYDSVSFRVFLVCGTTLLLFLISVTIEIILIAIGDSGLDCPLPAHLYNKGLLLPFTTRSNNTFSSYCSGWNGSNDTKMNSVVLKGTHNSYHIQPTYNFGFWGLNLLISSWRYTHPPVANALNSGIRHFEWDIHFGKEGRILNYHMPRLDAKSQCRCLQHCLQQVRRWSDAHPHHLPIFIMLEIKYKSFFEDPYGAPTIEDFDLLDKYFRSTWFDAPSRLFTPDNLRGNYSSLTERVLTCGWPNINFLRQKVVVLLMAGDDSPILENYLHGHKVLQERAMFLILAGEAYNKSKPYLAMLKFDDPTHDRDKIHERVLDGFIIRTRGNTNYAQPREQKERMAAAFASGAHLISLDHTEQWKDFNGDRAAICNDYVEASHLRHNISQNNVETPCNILPL